MRRYAAGWRRARRRDVVDAPTFIPLLFCPGEPCQFDWSHEDVEIAGKPDGEIVADHPRCFGRDRTIYDPWHYLPLLVTKPGALPNGAPIRTGNCRRLYHDCGASWAQAMTPTGGSYACCQPCSTMTEQKFAYDIQRIFLDPKTAYLADSVSAAIRWLRNRS